MDLLVQLTAVGLATGGIYAAMALALVVVHTTSGHLNFAQGEMATFSAFLAWQLADWGTGWWPAFAGSVALSFVAGIAIQRLLLDRTPVHPPLPRLVLTLALFAAFNGLSGVLWGFTPLPFESPFSGPPLAGGLIPVREVGVLVVVAVAFAAYALFLRFTTAGLEMRAMVDNRESARLMGVRVRRLGGVGFGIAAAFGAVAGVLSAPSLFLTPTMMSGVLLYGFAGAVLGGLSSPVGAVVGGLLVGIAENLVSAFFPMVGNDLKVPATLLLIVLVLVVRPEGLFAARARVRL